jgi:hypothetical protein
VVASAIPAHAGLARAYPDHISLVTTGARAGAVAEVVDEALAKGRVARPELTSWSAVADETLGIYGATFVR